MAETEADVGQADEAGGCEMDDEGVFKKPQRPARFAAEDSRQQQQQHEEGAEEEPPADGGEGGGGGSDGRRSKRRAAMAAQYRMRGYDEAAAEEEEEYEDAEYSEQVEDRQQDDEDDQDYNDAPASERRQSPRKRKSYAQPRSQAYFYDENHLEEDGYDEHQYGYEDELDDDIDLDGISPDDEEYGDHGGEEDYFRKRHLLEGTARIQKRVHIKEEPSASYAIQKVRKAKREVRARALPKSAAKRLKLYRERAQQNALARVAAGEVLELRAQVDALTHQLDAAAGKLKQRNDTIKVLAQRVQTLQGQVLAEKRRQAATQAKRQAAEVDMRTKEGLLSRVCHLYESLRNTVVKGEKIIESHLYRRWRPIEVLKRESEARAKFGLAPRRNISKVAGDDAASVASNGDVGGSSPQSASQGSVTTGRAPSVDSDDSRAEVGRKRGFYQCMKCLQGGLFMTLQAYEHHVQFRCLNDREEAKCPKCYHVFSSQLPMERHMKRCAVTEMDPLCKHCNTRVKNLKHHMEYSCRVLQEEGKIKPVYQCKTCERRFFSPHSYRNHHARNRCSADKSRSVGRLVCPMCPEGSERFTGGQEEFMQHLGDVHDVRTTIHSKVFPSQVAFDNWLLRFENDGSCRFRANNAEYRYFQSVIYDHDYYLYRCTYWRRKSNMDGSAAETVGDWGILCPAFVFAKCYRTDGTVHVRYCGDHRGHKREPQNPRGVSNKVKDFMADFLEKNPDASNDDIVAAVKGAKDTLSDVVLEYPRHLIIAALNLIRSDEWQRRRQERLEFKKARAESVLTVTNGSGSDGSDPLASLSLMSSVRPPASKRARRSVEPSAGHQHRHSTRQHDDRHHTVSPATAPAADHDPLCPAGFAPYLPSDLRVVRQLAARRGEPTEPAPLALEVAGSNSCFLRLAGQEPRAPNADAAYHHYGCHACGRHPVRLHKSTGRVFYDPVAWARDTCADGGAHPLYSLESLAAQELELVARRSLAATAVLAEPAAVVHVRAQCEAAVRSVAAQFNVDASVLHRHLYSLSDDTLRQWRREAFDSLNAFSCLYNFGAAGLP